MKGKAPPPKPSGTARCWVTASLVANVNVLFLGILQQVLLVNNNPEILSALNQLCTVTKESRGAGV